MDKLKKIFSAWVLMSFIFGSVVVSADTKFFDLSISPSTTSVSFNISYSGPDTTNVKVSVSGANGFYSEDSYTVIPGGIISSGLAGLLTPDTEYSLAVYSTDPDKSNNSQYANNQPFRTLKVNNTNNTGSSGNTNTGNQGTNTGNTGKTTGNPGTTTGGPGTNTGVKINSGIKNPLSSTFSDIPSFIKGVLKAVLIIGIPIITLAIIYSGFLFVTAQGNSEQLKKAKKAILYTLIGAALLLGSMVITEAIQKSVDDIKSTTK